MNSRTRANRHIGMAHLAELAAARVLLRCRPDASPAEVKTAFRNTVREAHPDTGNANVIDLDAVRTARETLLANAGPDRRRSAARTAVGTGAQTIDPTLMRRSTWNPQAPTEPTTDGYL
jgi:hypothetical protein